MRWFWQIFLRRRSEKRAPTSEPPVDDQALQPVVRAQVCAQTRAREIGGPSGAEPTRYGDWERKGRCIDF